jgi:hypothetical protein
MSDLTLRTRINATRTAVFTRFEDGEFLTTVIRPIGLQMGLYFDVSADAASAVAAHANILQRIMAFMNGGLADPVRYFHGRGLPALLATLPFARQMNDARMKLIIEIASEITFLLPISTHDEPAKIAAYILRTMERKIAEKEAV